MKVLAVIPARYLSSRLEKKLILDICGKSMLQRVYEQCLKCELIDKVMIAVDDLILRDHALSFGADVFLSSRQHESGTDRIAELATTETEFDIVINVQGDEPFIEPDHIALVIQSLIDSPCTISTLISSELTEEQIEDTNIVKVVKSIHGKALYFSRAVIPYIRDKRNLAKNVCYYKHLGLYGFKRSSLLEICSLPVSNLESCEKLEQLRWMENGFDIHTIEVQSSHKGIDTLEDLHQAIEYARRHKL